MTVKSGFFNSVNNDRVYLAHDFANYFSTFISNGIFPNPSNGMQLTASGGRSTTVKAGKGWINGYFVENDSDFLITHDLPDGILNRIDRIVLQKSTAGRDIKIVLKKGAYATSPTAPPIVRDPDFYELAIADVYVKAGVTTISQANITDLRLNNSLCGIVHALIDQVDTTTIFNQYQDWFNKYSVGESLKFEQWVTSFEQAANSWIDNEHLEFSAWRTGQELAFKAWFDLIKDQLTTDQAGNLFNIFNEHKEDPLPHKYTDSTNGKVYKVGFGVEAGIPFIAVEEVL